MKNYKQFIIKADPFNIDLLSGNLWNLEILGINEYDNYLTAFVYEDSELDIEKIEVSLNELKRQNLLNYFSVEVENVEGKNWNEEWEKKINVIEVTEKLVIKPTFKEYNAKPGQIILTIDPKMSFGTGEHQTTKIVLRLLEKYADNKKLVLDLGSGTGILGIAASKLGAENVICIDNDEWCYINAQENIERNEVKNVEIINGEIDKVKELKFDLVVANINKHILLSIYNQIKNVCVENCILILSGLLESDYDEIKKQYTQIGFTALEFLQQDEWIGIVFKN
ncbi:MAG: 50S ribosomal protein L11 methyltransferase [Ignavibacteriae bacterium]|jgi:ribosomal protein L11 methyltransferase|nr:50S ribosomal protein L11 methyltransferase [Ignavibacteriota bacterium]